MPSPRPVLFDLDGTLIDSVRLILDSYHHVTREHGLPQRTDDEWLAGLGTPLTTQFRQYMADETLMQELIKTYRAYNLAHHDQRVTIYPGVLDLLVEIKRRGHPTALVTSKNRAGAERGLNLVGLRPYFDVLVGADDVTNAKPDPEPVHLALQRLGVSGEGALFIGDSTHDVHAGNAAGVATVAVLWGPFSREHIAPSAPTYWVSAPHEILALL
jgi:pyrophosphatase PpaX